jgi:hypothetical protein
MHVTYKAILKGDRVEWIGEAPETNGGVPVEITVIKEETPEELKLRGQQMAEILNALAALNPFADIKDPVAWQREIRKDRPLPGRED